MPDSLLLAHLVVAATLVLAAIGKWRHPDVENRAFAGAGLPLWIGSDFVRRWHPVAELVLGLGIVLVPAPWNLAPVVGATVLVVAYLGLVVVALRAPAAVSCGCFGADDDTPVSRRTLARNILLVVAAVLALVDAALGGAVIGRLVDPVTWGWVLGALLAVLVTWLAVPAAGPAGVPGLSEALRDDGPEAVDDDLDDYVREEIPEVRVLDPEGYETGLRDLAARRAQLLLFLSPGCGSCAGIARDLPRWRERQLPIDVRAVVNGAALEMPGAPVWVETALVDPNGQAAQALKVHGTPGAVLLGTDGMLAGGPVLGSGAVREFYVEIAEQLEAAADLS